jgi:predicted transcriptional regulator
MTGEEDQTEPDQRKMKERLLENFFDALGSKKNRTILHVLLEDGPLTIQEIMMKVTVRGSKISRRLNALNIGGLIIQRPDRRITATPFAEMALAAIGVALERVELITSK